MPRPCSSSSSTSPDSRTPSGRYRSSRAGGFIGTVDFVWRSGLLVVEIDSTWHDGPLDREADAERDGRLDAAGYPVLRYRYGDLVVDPDRIVRDLGVAIGA